MRLALLAVVVVVSIAHDAGAESHWYDDTAGKRRRTHLAMSAFGGAIYAATETFLKPPLAPDHCRICNPTSYDREIRPAMLWSDPALARVISNVTGYVLAPAAALGWLAIVDRDTDVGRWIDDVIPVAETAVVAGLVNQVAKFSIGEQRPFVHFAPPGRAPQVDDNLSFFSGHATIAFAMATSAGEVARRRGSPVAPLIYATGYAIAIPTAYLRMAADKHYFTDVVVGAVVGTALGFAVPAISGVDIIPTGRGLALAGRF